MIKNVINQDQTKSLPASTKNRRIRQRQTDLHEVIQNVQDYLPGYIKGGVKPQVIPADYELPVMINVSQIEVALLHLINNALEAMPTGGCLTIKTGLTELQGRLSRESNCSDLNACAFISVSDTGHGMDEKTLSKIFEPFYTTKEGAYRGLGLSSVSHTIKQHNGGIYVESELGHGTTVNIYLPLAQKTQVYHEAIPLLPAGMHTSLPHQQE
jgi:two-component system, cell cycle sensor histidine kinase and response regulator CckA